MKLLLDTHLLLLAAASPERLSGTAMALMADRDNAARDVAVQLGVSVSTLYAYVDAKGQPRERASELLGKRGVQPKIAA